MLDFDGIVADEVVPLEDEGNGEALELDGNVLYEGDELEVMFAEDEWITCRCVRDEDGGVYIEVPQDDGIKTLIQPEPGMIYRL